MWTWNFKIKLFGSSSVTIRFLVRNGTSKKPLKVKTDQFLMKSRLRKQNSNLKIMKRQ